MLPYFVRTLSVLMAFILMGLLCVHPEAAAEENPLANSRVMVMQAKKAAAGGDVVGAINIYRQAVLITPPNVDAIIGLANLEEQVGNSANARQLWQRVLEINPGVLDAYTHLGFLSIQEENFASAVDYFQQCAEKAGAGDLHYAEAQRGLDAIMDRSPYYRSKIIKARAQRLQAALDADAATMQIKALDRQVNLYRAMIAQGRTLFTKKRYREAMDSFDLALEFMPDDGEAVKLRQAADMALHQEANNALTNTAINNLLSSRNP